MEIKKKKVRKLIIKMLKISRRITSMYADVLCPLQRRINGIRLFKHCCTKQQKRNYNFIKLLNVYE